MKLNTLRNALTVHLVRCGLRTWEHPTAPQSVNRIRKSISLSKGFRKRAISLFIEAGLNHEIRELIVDHATQLDQNYFRPTEDQILREYLKAEPYLTISNEARLNKKVETLQVQQRTEMEELKAEIDKVKALVGQG